MVPAIILAAGASTRMGLPKALLATERPGESFAVRLARTMSAGGAADVVVVAADLGADLQRHFDAAAVQARVVVNPDPDRGQLSSLICGLDRADRPGVGGVLVIPVDIPLVAPATVRDLIALHQRTAASIVRPRCAGRHGHPILFDRRVFADLRRTPLEQGARAVVRAHVADARVLEVGDHGAIDDADTPEEYARLFGHPPRLFSWRPAAGSG
jgi:CTP:molybdopterin cytidylyltransferase MocA